MRMHRLPALFLAGALAACAVARAPGDRPGEEPATGEAARRAAEALQDAEALHRAGQHEAAARRADSLYHVWRGDRSLAAVANRALWLKGLALEASGELPGARAALEELLGRVGEGAIRREATARLAAILHATGDDASLLRLLLEAPEGVGEEERRLMRSAAARLPPDELERLAVRFPLRGSAASVLYAELARSLALADRLDSARRVARRVVEAVPGTEEAEIATAVLRVGEPGGAALRIGAVLPLSGRFAAVGELLREGMELAIEEHRRRSPGRVAVELEVLDDGSDPERAVELARRLEREGAAAVVGPVRSESFAVAARARANPRLLLVSPTATEPPASAPNAYALWSHRHREWEVARDVAAWVADRLGLLRAAVLYPETPGGRWAAQGFREGMESRGGRVLAARAYAPDSTTFAEPIGAVAAVEPDVVFVAGESVPAILQLAPQLFYYGVDRSVVAGGAIWTEPAVIRRLDPLSANFRVVGTFVDRGAEGTPWSAFNAAYETKYRKLLRENMLPALGHDAVKLILAAAELSLLPLPGALSSAAAGLPEVAGATGGLRLDPETSAVRRRTLIRMIRDGELVSPDPGELLAWLEEARARADSVAQARADSVARARGGTSR